MEDCDRIHSLVEDLIKNCSSNPEGEQLVIHSNVQKNVQNNVQNFVPKGPKDVDIFSMLSKAQKEFNTGSVSGVPSVINGGSNGQGGPNNFLTKQQQQQQQQQLTMNQKFAAMQVHNNVRHQNQQQQQQMMINHQIQQHTTPVKQMNANAMPDITSQNVVNFFASATPNSKPSFSSNQNTGMLHQTVTLDEIEKQHRVSASPPNNNFNTTTEAKKMKPQNLNQLLNTAGQNHINMPIQHQPQPIRLSGNTAGPIILPHQVLTVEHQHQQQIIIQPSTKPALITPSMFQTSFNIEEKITNALQQTRPEPLTQNQLLQALNYLIDNEPDFLTKLHEAYMISFNKKTSI